MSLVPVVTATGPDPSMSAVGRLVAEVVLAPTTYASASWGAIADPDVARGSFSFPHGTERVELRIAADGQVQSVSMLRWGKPDEFFRAKITGAVLLGESP